MTNRTFLYACLFSLLLSSCSSNNVVNKKFFKNKAWTVWRNQSGDFSLFLSDTTNGHYRCVLVNLEDGKRVFLESNLVFNCERDPSKNVIQMDHPYKNRNRYYYFMSTVMNDNKADSDRIQIKNSSTDEIMIIESSCLSDEEIDMRCLYRCSLKSKNNNLNFEYVFTDKSVESGCHYYAKYNETRISLSFDDNKAFTITDGTNYTTGTYNATKEGVTLNIEDNHIFDESIKSLNYTYNFY